MKTNNFNQSSTGVNIESSCFFDTCLSQDTWRENFQSCKGEKTRFRGDEVYYYKDYGNLPNRLESMEYTIKGLKRDLIRYMDDMAFYTWDRDSSKSELQELVKDIIEQCEGGIAYWMIDSDLLDDYNLKIVPSHELNKIEIRGYSQGDYAEVLYCPADCNYPNESELKKLFENMFYDAPIYCRVMINDITYYYSDMDGCEVKSEYDWNREAWIEYVKNASGHDISEFVPEYPEYN